MSIQKDPDHRPTEPQPVRRKPQFQDWADLSPEEEAKLDEIWDEIGKENRDSEDRDSAA